MNSTTTKDTSGWSGRIKWFIAISIFLHLLFFYSYGVVTGFRFFQPLNDLEKIDDQLKDKEIVFDVIQTPNEPDKRPDRADLLSDKNSRAQNPQKTEEQDIKPFSEGQSVYPVQPNPAEQNEPGLPAKEPKPDSKEEIQPDKPEPVEEFSLFNSSRQSFRDLLLGKKPQPNGDKPKPNYDNREFSVDDLGGFAFNTYNWNFAPYMLYLKKRIEQHIFPPPAYSKMGIIDGKTVLRFLISKDGKLVKMIVLTYKGHKSLMETSVNAVSASAPFRPLPSDFPEDKLEVTGTFIYNVYR